MTSSRSCWTVLWFVAAAAAAQSPSQRQANGTIGPASCTPDNSACCADGGSIVVPETRGLDPAAAIRRLKAAGLPRVRRVARPSDGMPPGAVMASNPHASVRLCIASPVILYVADAPAAAHLRNFKGDTVAEARARLAGPLETRMSFSSCGVGRRVSVDDPRSILVVVAQSPPEGTVIDNTWDSGELHLAPKPEYVDDLAGLSVKDARSRVLVEPALSGWQVSPHSYGAASAPPISGLRVLGATADGKRCTIKLVLAEAPPSQVSDVASAAQADVPGVPLPPAVPLGGGALGGLLLARAFWPRNVESTHVQSAQAASSNSTKPRLRVRRLVEDPDAGPLS